MSATEPAVPELSRLRSALVVAACCCSAGLIIGLAASAIALTPVIGRDLGGTQSDLQWISDAFPLLLAALLLPAGAVLDRFGRRRGMLAGFVVMIAALAWSARAGSVETLIAARCLTGIGAALVFPGTLSTINAVLPPARRQAAVSLWGLSMVSGAVVGLIVSALMAQEWGWAVPFGAFAVFAVVMLALNAAVVPETRSAEPPGLDPIGALTSFGAVGFVVLAVAEGPVHGWGSATTVGPALLAVALTAAFIAWELRHPHPLLEVRLLADRRFGAASITLFVAFLAHFMMFFLAIQYMVFAAGLGTVEAALGIAPPAIGFLTIPFGPAVTRRIGARRTLLLSLAVMVLGASVAIGYAGLSSPSWWVWMATGLVSWAGLGIGAVTPTEMIIDAVPPEKQGVASAVNDLTRELGAAFGIAFAGSAFNTAYRASLDGGIAGLDPEAVAAVRDSPAAGLALFGDSPAVVSAVQDAVVAGWQWGFGVSLACLVAGAVAVAWRCPADAPAPEVARRERAQAAR